MLRSAFSCFGVCTEIAEHLIIPTEMDKTCLDTSSWEFICEPGFGMYPHVEVNNYVPLFGVDPIECRLTLLRNT